MNKYSLYYILANFLLFPLMEIQEVTVFILTPICLLGLFSVGVAHGSIDHILYGADQGSEKNKFVSKYLLVILMVGVLWYISPNISLLFFLFLSAYHFGQSQFADYLFSQSLEVRLLYFSWGIFLFSLLFFFKGEEIQGSMTSYFPNITIIFYLKDVALLVLIFSGILWLVLFVRKIYCLNLDLQSLFSELYLIILISISFYIFPTLVAFSLYFIILHSFRSMDQEYHHLFNGYSSKKIYNFLKLLFPFTFLAMFGSAIIILITMGFGFSNYIPYILLILLSSVTAPHAFVMHHFLEHKRHTLI